MKARIIQVIVASCLLLQFSLQSCLIDPDETQGSSFSGTIKATVNTGGVDVDEVKVHISRYDLDEVGLPPPEISRGDVVQFFDGSIDDFHLRSTEGESVKMRADGVDVDEGLATGTYMNGMYGYDELTLNFLNPVPDKYLSSLLPVADAKMTGAFINSGGIKAYKNGTQVGCFFYANVDVNANMDNLTVGDAFAGFVYADRDVTINVSFDTIEAYWFNNFAPESGLHTRKERMRDSPFGSKIFLKKGWNKLYLIWQQFESEIEKSGVGAGWKVTTQEPEGMKWYFSKGSTAIQGKLQGNSKMDDYIDIEKTIVRVTGVSFQQGVLSLRVGQEGYLQAIVTPSNATYPEVNWETSNEFVAIVNPSARQDIPGTGVVFTSRVNAYGVGTTRITATTIDGSRQVATAIVYVYTLTNAAPPTITVQFPQYATYEQGAPAAPLVVSATSPDGGILSYQWYSKKGEDIFSTPGVGDAIPGATSLTYTPPTNVVGTTRYCVIVTSYNSSLDGNQTATTQSDFADILVTPK